MRFLVALIVGLTPVVSNAIPEITFRADGGHFLFSDDIMLTLGTQIVAPLNCRSYEGKWSSLDYDEVYHRILTRDCLIIADKLKRNLVTPNTPLEFHLGSKSDVISWKHCKNKDCTEAF